MSTTLHSQRSSQASSGQASCARSSARHPLPDEQILLSWQPQEDELSELERRCSVAAELGLDWQALERGLPFVAASGEDLHLYRRLVIESSDFAVWAHFPGKHADETEGGDFGVQMQDRSRPRSLNVAWFPSHEQIFADVGDKCLAAPAWMLEEFGPALTAVVWEGHSPLEVAALWQSPPALPGLDVLGLFCLCQAIALAEHRSYHAFERNGQGGR